LRAQAVQRFALGSDRAQPQLVIFGRSLRLVVVFGDLAGDVRKPSCLISCSHWLPDGSFVVLIGRHGAMNPEATLQHNADS
jgi:hypothetical protein